MLDIQQLDGFDWDDGNSNKNWILHQVSDSECEEVFLNVPTLLADDGRHSQSEKRYLLLGRTNAGRKLLVAFTVRHTKIRVISARDMNRKEKNAYAEVDS